MNIIDIEFCEKCKSAMQPTKSGFRCRRCGFEMKKESTAKITTKSKKEAVVVIEDNSPYLPKTDKECPKCLNREAWYWLIQTRASDEPPTQFFKCTSCKHIWREYK